MKSGLYFYENCTPVKIISSGHRSFSSVQDSVPGFVTRLQKGIFYAFELLKRPTMEDSTEKMNFDISFMISQKNFEIRTVLYENGLVRKGSCLTIIAVFLSTRFSSRLYNLTATKYFSVPYIIVISIDRGH